MTYTIGNGIIPALPSVMKPVVIITGSSSGFGQDIAGELSRKGYALTLCGRNEKGLETTKSLCLENGASQEDINNAAFTSSPDPLFESTTADVFDYMAKLNLRAPMFLTQACVPLLTESKGTVINISTSVVNMPKLPFPLYGTLKAGLDYFTESAACAFGAKGIRVCGIRPSYVSTGVDVNIFKNFSEEEKLKFQKEMVDTQVIKRPGEKRDVTQLVAFLLSDKASFITGVNINVDGGNQFQMTSHTE